MIAISYRRQDSSSVAGRLYDRLQNEFGKGSVFMDFDSIPYGVDFRDHIKQTLQRAKVVVAIIGPDWSGGRDLSKRRIDDPADFVRLEVASALESGIPIIPVLINNTPMPDAQSLPPALEALAYRNGLALDTGIDFHHHADRLIAGIHRVLDPAAASAPKAASKKAWPLLLAVGVVAAIAASVVWYFVSRTTNEPSRLTSETATSSVASATAAPASTASAPPLATSPAPVIPATANEIGRENTYSGKIGKGDAVFRFRFEANERVTGSYSQGGSTYRLEGRNPPGKMFLDEYTGERVSAHVELSLVESATEIRWQGQMRNTPPDNRVLPVSFGRPRS
jgi:hypothetical protein